MTSIGGGLILAALIARVGGARGIPAPQRHWTWQALLDGRTLPAGVYFVRARDDAGNTATQRIALIR